MTRCPDPAEPTSTLRRVAAHPLTLAASHLLAPLFCVGVIAKALYLAWERLAPRACWSLGLLLAGACSLMLLGGLGILCKRARTRAFFALTFAIGGAVLFRWLWTLTESDALAELPVFAFNPIDAFLVPWGLTLPLICALAWLFGEPKLSRANAVRFGVRTLLAFLASALTVIGLFAITPVMGVAGLPLFLLILLIYALLFGWLFFLVGVLERCLRLERCRTRLAQWALRLFICALAIIGLALNVFISFPARLAQPGLWALALAAILFLLTPAGRGLYAKLRFLAGCALLPFSLYIFLLFLPFMALALPAMLLFGAGLLLLAPMGFLLLHLLTLRNARAAAGPHRARLLLGLGVVAALLLPLAFLLQTERERTQVRCLVSALATPNFTAASDALPMAPDAARHAAQLTLDLANGNTLPLLSRWREVRLFDGMRPRAETLRAMEKRFGLAHHKLPLTAMSFLGSNASRAAAFERDHSWHQTDRGATLRVKGPTDGRKLTVAISLTPQTSTSGLPFGAPDFAAPLTLAEGVWITNLRLKLPEGGEWKSATRRDRRVAEWVYNTTRENSLRQDPALLTLSDATHGRLRVSPLSEVREVEIDLLMPEAYWCQQPLTLGDAALTLQPPEGVSPAPATFEQTPEATLCLVAPGFTGPYPDIEGPALYVLAAPEITVSDTPPALPTPEADDFDGERAIRFARGNLYARAWRLGRVLTLGEGWTEVAKTLTPEPPRRVLPKLPPDDPWQLGAQAWQLSELLAHNQTLPHRDAVRALAARSGVLTPSEALIVLESAAQEKGLALADFAYRNADDAFTLHDETPSSPQDAPTFLLLLLCALLLHCVWRRARSAR